MMRAKLIQDGDHQTIVLPPSIHLEGDEVVVEKNGSPGGLTISPLQPDAQLEPGAGTDWQAVFRAFDEADIPDDFLRDRDTSPPQERPDW